MKDLKEKQKEIKSEISTLLRQRQFYYSKVREINDELEELRQEELVVKMKISFSEFKRGKK